jgi:dTDP-4-dehydrorhamnose reductase
MRVTILGATGLLGKALVRCWTDDQVSAFGSRYADICNPGQISELLARTSPDWVVLAAAYTDVDGCETNSEMAFAVNRDGAVNVAAGCKAVGAKLMLLSSDYVFDGTKKAPYQTTELRCPMSVYGRSKAEAEEQVLAVLPDACIVRTSWLFGTGGKCFPDTILKAAATRPELDVVDDQRGSPTYSVDLAEAIIGLCRRGAKGIIHATNSGDCTWFEFARRILSESRSQTVVRPSTTAKMARPAPRPAYSVLSPASLNAYGIQMPPWQDALRRYLTERNQP